MAFPRDSEHTTRTAYTDFVNTIQDYENDDGPRASVAQTTASYETDSEEETEYEDETQYEDEDDDEDEDEYEEDDEDDDEEYEDEYDDEDGEEYEDEDEDGEEYDDEDGEEYEDEDEDEDGEEYEDGEDYDDEDEYAEGDEEATEEFEDEADYDDEDEDEDEDDEEYDDDEYDDEDSEEEDESDVSDSDEDDSDDEEEEDDEDDNEINTFAFGDSFDGADSSSEEDPFDDEETTSPFATQGGANGRFALTQREQLIRDREKAVNTRERKTTRWMLMIVSLICCGAIAVLMLYIFGVGPFADKEESPPISENLTTSAPTVAPVMSPTTSPSPSVSVPPSGSLQIPEYVVDPKYQVLVPLGLSNQVSLDLLTEDLIDLMDNLAPVVLSEYLAESKRALRGTARSLQSSSIKLPTSIQSADQIGKTLHAGYSLRNHIFANLFPISDCPIFAEVDSLCVEVTANVVLLSEDITLSQLIEYRDLLIQALSINRLESFTEETGVETEIFVFGVDEATSDLFSGAPSLSPTDIGGSDGSNNPTSDAVNGTSTPSGLPSTQPEFSALPSIAPSQNPTLEGEQNNGTSTPNNGISMSPSLEPTLSPSPTSIFNNETDIETDVPSFSPTNDTLADGTDTPTLSPTNDTLIDDTDSPTLSPTNDTSIDSEAPSTSPVNDTLVSEEPSASPSNESLVESEAPSMAPVNDTIYDSEAPSESPTVEGFQPTNETEAPSLSPTSNETDPDASASPTPVPVDANATDAPSSSPSTGSTDSPSSTPSMSPTVEPVRYFAIGGETNALGWGDLNQLITFSFQDEKYKKFVSSSFQPIERDDVFVTFENSYGDFISDDFGKLSYLYGVDGGHFGPELGFGFRLGDVFDEDIVIVKGGGVSPLADKWVPPSSNEGTPGEFYQKFVADINDSIANVDQITGSPSPPAQLAGLIWFHGFSDAFNDGFRNTYEENLQNLITDLRTDLDEPDLPIVIVEMGAGGENARTEELEMREIQQRVVNANNFTAYCETAKFITFDTESTTQGQNRYYGRADVFVSIGEEMAGQWVAARSAQAITQDGITVRSVDEGDRIGSDVGLLVLDDVQGDGEGLIVR